MEQKYIKFIAQSKKDYFDLLKSVISIPSPSYKEREIAVKIKDFLEQEAEKNHNCRANIYTDDIWNVYCEIGGPFHTDTECVLFCAHTDTVFPDDNKKYLSTDLSMPIDDNSEYLSNKIELLDYEFVK